MKRFGLPSALCGWVSVIALAMAVGCGKAAAPAPPMPPAKPGATIQVTPATFVGTIAAAKPGDTLVLADGEYVPPATQVRTIAVQSSAPGGYARVAVMRPGGFAVSCSGVPGSPITIRAGGKGTVIKGTMRLDGLSYVILDGVRIDGAYMYGVMAKGSDHLDIRNCVVSNVDGNYGMFIDNARAAIIENNEVYGTKKNGICVFGDSRDVTVRGNKVHECDSCGIYFDAYTNPGKRLSNILCENNIVSHVGKNGGAAMNVSNVVDSVFRNNLLYKNEAGGMCFYQAEVSDASSSGGVPSPDGIVQRVLAFVTSRPANCARNKVISNTVYFEPGHGRWCLRMPDKAPDFYVHNNVFVGGMYGVVSVAPKSFKGLSMDDNLIATSEGQQLFGDLQLNGGMESFIYTMDEWHAKGFDRRSKIGVEALFVSIPKDDYRLSPKSPAVDAGANLGGNCAADIEGTKRPSGKGYDCGAYEYAPKGRE